MSVSAIKAEKPVKHGIVFYICIAHYFNQGLCITRLWGAVTVWNTPSSTCLSQRRMQKHIKYPFPWWLSGLSRALTVVPVYCASLFLAEELTCDNKRQITCKRPRFVTPVCLSGPEQGIQPQTLWFLSVLHQRKPFECLRPSPQWTKHPLFSVVEKNTWMPFFVTEWKVCCVFLTRQNMQFLNRHFYPSPSTVRTSTRTAWHQWQRHLCQVRGSKYKVVFIH